MKSRRLVAVLAGSAALAIPAAAVAQEGFVKVTGGGQVIADSSGGGPGDTIAFNAQQTGEGGMMSSDPAKGELQVVNRGGAGQGVRFHGDVTCIRDMRGPNGDGVIRFGGYEKVRGQTTAEPFVVDVDDNGEGAMGGNDMIAFRESDNASDPCSDSERGTRLDGTRLARGNVQDHD